MSSYSFLKHITTVIMAIVTARRKLYLKLILLGSSLNISISLANELVTHSRCHCHQEQLLKGNWERGSLKLRGRRLNLEGFSPLLLYSEIIDKIINFKTWQSWIYNYFIKIAKASIKQPKSDFIRKKLKCQIKQPIASKQLATSNHSPNHKYQQGVACSQATF